MPLSFPPLVEIRRGKPIVLSAETTQVKLDGDHYAEVWGFNGNYLGPTIKIRSGEFAKLNYRNGIPQIIAKYSRLQAGGELLGGIGRHFKMGETRRRLFRLINRRRPVGIMLALLPARHIKPIVDCLGYGLLKMRKVANHHCRKIWRRRYSVNFARWSTQC